MTDEIRLRAVDGSKHSVWATIRSLHEELFGDDAPMPDPAKGFWWIAYRGREPVGFAGMLLGIWHDNAGYFYRCAVTPSARGQGLQRRFILAREKAARKLGWTSIYTDTTDNRHSARNLRLAGYSLYEPEVRYSDLDDSKYWRKTL